MTFGERIKSFRLLRGMTQQQLADKVGFKSKTSINKLESGERDADQKLIMQLALALDITPEMLFFDKAVESAKAESDRMVLNRFNKLTLENRNLILAMMDTMISQQKESVEAYEEGKRRWGPDYDG